MTGRLWWFLAATALLGCGDDFVGPCVPDDAGKGCDAGTSPDGGGGSAGMSSGTSGTGATNSGDGGMRTDAGNNMTDDDAGEMPPTGMDASTSMDAAAPTDASQPNPDAGNPNTPPADGTQLAPCDVLDPDSCDEGLACYVRGAGSGYCSATCENDEDCAALQGAEYTCSTTFGGGGQGPGGGMGICRVECEGEDDTESCPGSLVCLRVGGQGNGQGNGGAFRCGYPAEPPTGGDGTVARFGRCQDSADCMGDLVCYGSFQGATDGFCTDTCETNDDCSEDPGSGDIDPTCGSQNMCRFDCSQGGTCPDGMECESELRCVYSAQ